jgi:uncharacterized protein (TIGR02145 family)
VEIGSQTWMAENLNYNVSGSKCIGDSVDAYGVVKIYSLEDGNTINCDKHGRLYDFATAMRYDETCNSSYCNNTLAKRRGICPEGWHIPGDSEWTGLVNAVDAFAFGTNNYAGRKLKAANGWSGASSNGTDDYGFAALPGGYGLNSSFSMSVSGAYGYWWSASESGINTAYIRSMRHSGDNVSATSESKMSLYSVRCVKD